MSLTNMQYDEIIRSYNRTSLENKREQNERISLVYEKVPRIKEINDEISSLSLETTKKMLVSDEQDHGVVSVSEHMSEFKKRLNVLRNEKITLLTQNGFSSDYMDMHYNCPDCMDTGYIDNQKCHCFKKAEINILYRQSNLNDILEKENFDTFQINYFNDTDTDHSTGKTPKENMLNVLSICHNFADYFGTDYAKYYNLLLFGKTGVGKTFLTYCIAKELLDKAFSVVYLSAIGFFDILSSAEFDHEDMEASSKALTLFNCDLLIIDDLGTELSNSFTNSVFFNIVNERLLNKKSVIISTNLIFPELMDRYSERLTSRLTKDYTFLKIFGEDLRHRF